MMHSSTSNTAKPLLKTKPRIQNFDYLTFTPPYQLKPYDAFDTFWLHKKRLLWDIKKIKQLDHWALTAPSRLKSNPEALVQHLTKGLSGTLDKVRVIMRWIGDNVAYDTHYLESGIRGDYSPGAVLASGQAVCQGYSDIFVHLCNLARIECESISGISKGALYYPGYKFDPTDPTKDPCAHAWNKVRIGGQWYLCDPAWAAGTVGNERGPRRFTKKWDEAWFLTHPAAFLPTHLPYKHDGGVIMEEQLVSEPVGSVEEWNSRVQMDPLAHAYNIRPLSHLHEVITTSGSGMSITYDNPNHHIMDQWAVLTDSKTAEKFRHCVVLYVVDRKVQVDVRLPKRGKFELQILGQHADPSWPNERARQPAIQLLCYKIVCKTTKGVGFPKGTDSFLGPNPYYKAAGFELLSPKSPVIVTEDGLCQIQMKLPIVGTVPTFHDLFHKKVEPSTLRACVYGEKDGNMATYYIRCPRTGEYRFEVKFKPCENTSYYYVGAAFLIQCSKPAKDAYCFTDDNHLAGPRPEFHSEFELKSKTRCSTLDVSSDGTTELVIYKRKPTEIFAKLYQADGSKTKVDRDVQSDHVRFHIKSPGKGYHFLKVYACPVKQKSGNLVAMYCVRNLSFAFTLKT